MTLDTAEKENQTTPATAPENAQPEIVQEATSPEGDVVTISAEALQAQLEAAKAEAAANLDNWQRTAAEMANFKRRQLEQANRRREDTIAEIISQIFPVLDDFDLAFKNVPAELTEKEANWVSGFTLVQRKLQKVLEQNEVQPIDATGEFNPNLHEAVTHENSPEHASNAIIAELRKGYKLGERVLRPTLVRVAQ